MGHPPWIAGIAVTAMRLFIPHHYAAPRPPDRFSRFLEGTFDFHGGAKKVLTSRRPT
jgi:hypothetical protein